MAESWDGVELKFMKNSTSHDERQELAAIHRNESQDNVPVPADMTRLPGIL